MWLPSVRSVLVGVIAISHRSFRPRRSSARHSGQPYSANMSQLKALSVQQACCQLYEMYKRQPYVLGIAPLVLAPVQDVTFVTTDRTTIQRGPDEGAPMADRKAGCHCNSRTGDRRTVRGDGQGPQERRHRLPLEHRHRRRLDRARLLAGGDARLHRRRQRLGVHAPAVMLVSFLPMLLVASAYKYFNRADPDAGTTFAWTTRAFGPIHGLDQRLGDLPRRRDRDGLAGGIAAIYTFQLFGFTELGESKAAIIIAAVAVDRDDDLDLLPRHRALGAHPAGAARHRGLDPRDVRGGRVRQGLRQPPAGRLDQAVASTGSTRSR